MPKSGALLLYIALALVVSPSLGIYLPGVAPNDYTKDEEVSVAVQGLSAPACGLSPCARVLRSAAGNNIIACLLCGFVFRQLNIKVDKLSSINTALSYDYYSLKICEVSLRRPQ